MDDELLYTIHQVKEKLGELNFDKYAVYLAGSQCFYLVDQDILLIESEPHVMLRYLYDDKWGILDTRHRNPSIVEEIRDKQLIEWLQKLDEELENNEEYQRYWL